jgi:hypothetical protein
MPVENVVDRHHAPSHDRPLPIRNHCDEDQPDCSEKTRATTRSAVRGVASLLRQQYFVIFARDGELAGWLAVFELVMACIAGRLGQGELVVEGVFCHVGWRAGFGEGVCSDDGEGGVDTAGAGCGDFSGGLMQQGLVVFFVER